MSEYKTHPPCKSSLYFNKQPLKGDSSQVSVLTKRNQKHFAAGIESSALIPAYGSGGALGTLGGRMFFCDVYNRENSKFK
jgi:hypothetical protein